MSDSIRDVLMYELRSKKLHDKGSSAILVRLIPYSQKNVVRSLQNVQAYKNEFERKKGMSVQIKGKMVEHQGNVWEDNIVS